MIWPLVVLGVAFIAGLVTIIISGHNADDLTKAITAFGATLGSVAGAGAWIQARQASKQTNGALDQRMEAAFHRGLASALQEAQSRPSKHRPPAAGATQNLSPPPPP